MAKRATIRNSARFLGLLLLFISDVRCLLVTNSTDVTNENHAVQLVRGLKSRIRNQIVSLLSPSLNQVNQSNSCLTLLQATLQLPNNSPQFEWLMQMYDASGSLPNGLLAGTTSSFGDFDECLQLSHHAVRHSSQFCLLTLRARRLERYTNFHFTAAQRDSLSEFDQKLIERWLAIDNRVPIVIGLCLPKVCTPHQVTNITLNANSLLKHFDTSVKYCQSKSQDGDTGQVLPLIYGLLLLATLVATGTLLELISQAKIGGEWERLWSSTPIRVVCCFSVITNCQRLASVEDRGLKVEPRLDSVAGKHYTKANLQILDGIRVATILWIIFAHCSAFTQVPLLMKVSPFAHYPHDLIRTKNENWILSTYLMNTFYAVSVFFMIGGILVGYNRKSLPHVQCNLILHFLRHIAKRILRISPTFLVVIALTYYLRYLGSGPLFHQDLLESYVEPCRTNFWYHFFYLHNYLYTDQRCGSHTWYLAADFQLQILAFAVVHLARCCSKKFIAFLLAFGLMAVSGLLPLAFTLLGMGTFPNFDVYIDSRLQFPGLDLNLFYYSTYMHTGSFFLGLFVGFMLSTSWSFSFIQKNKTLCMTVALMSLGTCVMVPLAMRYLVLEQHLYQLSPLFTVLAFQFFAYLFNGTLAIFIFVCALNPDSMICRLMAVKFLRPFSRLVFCAYLSHQMLIWFTIQQLRSPLNVDFGSLVLSITLHMVGWLSTHLRLQFSFSVKIIGITVGMSLLLYLLVECPFTRISEIIFFKQASRPTVVDPICKSKLNQANLHSVSPFTKPRQAVPQNTIISNLNNNFLP